MAEAILFESSNATTISASTLATGSEIGAYNGLNGVNATDPFPTATPEPHSFELPANIQILMFVMYGLLAFAAVASNMIVCYIVLSNQRMRTATNYFIVNLAVGDILMAMLCIPFSFRANFIDGYWRFGLTLCVIVSYAQANSVFISAYTMVAISIDKYLAIIYPMRLRMSKVQSKIIILVIWSAALITSLPIALVSNITDRSGQPVSSIILVKTKTIGNTTNSTDPQDSSTSVISQEDHSQKGHCSETWSLWPQGKYIYGMLLMILQFILPLFVLVITYTRIVIIVWGKRIPGEEDNARDARMARSKRKMIKMVIFCVIAFALTWLPFNIFMVFTDLYPSVWDDPHSVYLWFVTHYLAMCHTVTNPLIYIWMNNRFRAGFKQVISDLQTFICRILTFLSCYVFCCACLFECSHKRYARLSFDLEHKLQSRRAPLTSTGSTNAITPHAAGAGGGTGTGTGGTGGFGAGGGAGAGIRSGTISYGGGGAGAHNGGNWLNSNYNGNLKSAGNNNSSYNNGGITQVAPNNGGGNGRIHQPMALTTTEGSRRSLAAVHHNKLRQAAEEHQLLEVSGAGGGGVNKSAPVIQSQHSSSSGAAAAGHSHEQAAPAEQTTVLDSATLGQASLSRPPLTVDTELGNAPAAAHGSRVYAPEVNRSQLAASEQRNCGVHLKLEQLASKELRLSAPAVANNSANSNNSPTSAEKKKKKRKKKQTHSISLQITSTQHYRGDSVAGIGVGVGKGAGAGAGAGAGKATELQEPPTSNTSFALCSFVSNPGRLTKFRSSPSPGGGGSAPSGSPTRATALHETSSIGTCTDAGVASAGARVDHGPVKSPTATAAAARAKLSALGSASFSIDAQQSSQSTATTSAQTNNTSLAMSPLQSSITRPAEEAVDVQSTTSASSLSNATGKSSNHNKNINNDGTSKRADGSCNSSPAKLSRADGSGSGTDANDDDASCTRLIDEARAGNGRAEQPSGNRPWTRANSSGGETSDGPTDGFSIGGGGGREFVAERRKQPTNRRRLPEAIIRGTDRSDKTVPSEAPATSALAAATVAAATMGFKSTADGSTTATTTTTKPLAPRHSCPRVDLLAGNGFASGSGDDDADEREEQQEQELPLLANYERMGANIVIQHRPESADGGRGSAHCALIGAPERDCDAANVCDIVSRLGGLGGALVPGRSPGPSSGGAARRDSGERLSASDGQLTEEIVNGQGLQYRQRPFIRSQKAPGRCIKASETGERDDVAAAGLLLDNDDCGADEGRCKQLRPRQDQHQLQQQQQQQQHDSGDSCSDTSARMMRSKATVASGKQRCRSSGSFGSMDSTHQSRDEEDDDDDEPVDSSGDCAAPGARGRAQAREAALRVGFNPEVRRSGKGGSSANKTTCTEVASDSTCEMMAAAGAAGSCFPGGSCSSNGNGECDGGDRAISKSISETADATNAEALAQQFSVLKEIAL